MTLAEPSATAAHTSCTYFLDESGNSGDLARPGPQFAFDGQEIFVLAGVGLAEPERLHELLARLKRDHRVQAAELKFDAVRKKPRFVADLVEGLDQLNANLLSEVVDKRYFIAAHMVSSLVLPPIPGTTPSAQESFVRSGLAEYLANAPTGVFRAFVDACQTPSGGALIATFQAILRWLDGAHSGDLPLALRHAAELALQEFRDEGPDDPEVVARWLPSPDPSLSGAPLWILPNLSSFTNIYARINRAHARRLERVRLVHDQQRYYAHVLTENKRLAEGLASQGLAIDFQHADWRFETHAQLSFANSVDAPGVQAADVLAGFLMTYVRNKLHRTNLMAPEWRAVFGKLLDLSDAERGLGINLVVPDVAFRRLGILPKVDPWITSGLGRQ